MQSFGFGQHLTADTYAVAFGIGIHSGYGSFTAGDNNYNNGNWSTVFGIENYTTSNTSYNFVVGTYNNAYDDYGMMQGHGNIIYQGSHSMVLGVYNQVGDATTTAANHSVAIGYGLKVQRNHAFITGQYNADPTGPIFAIGNGTNNTNRSNLFAIYDTNDESTVHADYFIGDGSGLTGLAGGQIHGTGGFVGIGTSVPSAKLDVSGGAAYFRGGTGGDISDGITYAALRVGNHLGMDSNRIGFFTTADIGTMSNHDLRFNTNGSTRMTIKANGNIRVGTGNPTSGYKLDIGGALQIDGAADVQTQLTVGGNVGVATTSPLSKVHIQDADAQLQIGQTPANSWKFWGGVNLHVQNSSGEDVMKIEANKTVIFSGAVRIAQAQGDIPQGDFD